MSNKMIGKILKSAYHRNGVCGNGFFVFLFVEKGTGDKKLGILFPDTPGDCAILSMDLLTQDVIEFGVNSWRGDHYEKELFDASGWESE